MFQAAEEPASMSKGKEECSRGGEKQHRGETGGSKGLRLQRRSGGECTGSAGHAAAGAHLIKKIQCILYYCVQ